MSAGKRHVNHGLRKRCRCGRARWSKCEHPWHFNYKWRGVHHRLCLDKHLGRRVEGRIEAEREARTLRTAIEDGTFGAPLPARERLTVEQLLTTYVKDYVEPEHPRGLANTRYQVGSIVRTILELPTGEQRAFGAWLVEDVNTAAVEKFRSARRTPAIVSAVDEDGLTRKRRVGGTTTTNRNLALLRAAFNWAVRLGILEDTPFKRGVVTVVRLSQELSRRRRLEGDEGERLLQACGARLRPIVEAAIETGCRSGELLSLQWWQVRNLDGAKPELALPATKTKTARDRVVPVSSRLRPILDMRRNDPAGEPHGPQAYVFGNEVGQRTLSIKTAWRLACRRAKIHDLHFHDLRREAGSRWLEGGVPLQTVRDWLGHANISQTSTYLESTLKGQHEAMRRFEAHQAARVQPGATDEGTAGLQPPRSADQSDTNPQKAVN